MDRTATRPNRACSNPSARRRAGDAGGEINDPIQTSGTRARAASSAASLAGSVADLAAPATSPVAPPASQAAISLALPELAIVVYRPAEVMATPSSAALSHPVELSNLRITPRSTFTAKDFETGFMAALQHDDAGAVAKLLDQGFDPNTTMAGNKAAIVLAAGKGCSKLIALLIERGLQLEKNDQGAKALCTAVWQRHERVVVLLLQHGCDARQVDHAGHTLLMIAAQGCSPATLERLIEYGADVNALSASGMSAAIFAIKDAKLDNLRMLLKYKATLDVDHWVAAGMLRDGGAGGAGGRRDHRLQNVRAGFVEILLEHGMQFNRENWVCEQSLVVADLLRCHVLPADLLSGNAQTPLGFIDTWIAALDQVCDLPLHLDSGFTQRMLTGGVAALNIVWLRQTLGSLHYGAELWVPLSMQGWPPEPTDPRAAGRHPPTLMQKRMVCAGLLASLPTDAVRLKPIYLAEGVSETGANRLTALAEAQRKTLVQCGQSALHDTLSVHLGKLALDCAELLSCNASFDFDELEQGLREQAGLWQPLVWLVVESAERAAANVARLLPPLTLAVPGGVASDPSVTLFKAQWSMIFFEQLPGEDWQQHYTGIFLSMGKICNRAQFMESVKWQIDMLKKFFKHIVEAGAEPVEDAGAEPVEYAGAERL